MSILALAQSILRCVWTGYRFSFALASSARTKISFKLVYFAFECLHSFFPCILHLRHWDQVQWVLHSDNERQDSSHNHSSTRTSWSRLSSRDVNNVPS
ncbi:uncharacterized protein BKA78DRAFT_177204 [Phyllosticta capitalensis]|uniref:uncharacterized protein n=1 Tax=Phyllosticta capitalensis TaxID=121624 RepID=UPI0031316679